MNTYKGKEVPRTRYFKELFNFWNGSTTCARTGVRCGRTWCGHCIFEESRGSEGEDVGILGDYLANVNFGNKDFTYIYLKKKTTDFDE